MESFKIETQSAKAKGRKLQQWVRDQIIEQLEVHPEDIESRSMGAGGERFNYGSCRKTESFPSVLSVRM